MSNHPVADAILRGDHDGEISMIQQACTARLKRQFRPGMAIRVTDGSMMGSVGKVIKVNPKRIAIDLGADGKWNYPPTMLELVS